MDTEIWPNFILKLIKKIPLILLNARITKKFQRWRFSVNTKKFSVAFQLASHQVQLLSVLKNLGAQNIKFYGNIKFCSSIGKILIIKINLIVSLR